MVIGYTLQEFDL